MSAKIIKKIIIQAQLVCESPLRICSGQTDNIIDMLVLKNKNGQPFVPGTSLAGVLRDEIVSLYNDEVADFVFGTIQEDGNQSLLAISDVVLKNSKISVRDGVKINSLAGTAGQGAKFDFEVVERGCEGDLLMEITIREAHINKADKFKSILRHNLKGNDFFDDLAATISEMLSAGISVGAITAKGFGKMRSKGKCGYVVFDFKNDNDAAEKWLSYLKDGKLPSNTFIVEENAVQYAKKNFVLDAEFALKSSLLVRDYDVEEYIDSNAGSISAVQMKSGDKYLIPGSSVKGAMRSCAEKILLAIIGEKQEKLKKFEKSKKFLDNLMGFANVNGTAGKRSQLFVDEVYIDKRVLVEQKQTRNRIDRFTGGTIESALFTEIPVWQRNKGVPVIKLHCCVRECTKAQAGLMLLLLREMWLGDLAFGGGKTIGRGVVEGISANIYYNGDSFVIQDENIKFIVSGDKSKLEEYVGALVGEIDG